MPAVSLDHVNIRVSPDLLASVRRFYVEVVGLVDGARPPFGSVGHWLYAGTQPVIHLSVLRAGDIPGSTAAPQAESASGGAVDHIAFGCDDLDGMLSRLAALGIAYRSATVPLLEQTQLFLRDPAGNGVELNFSAHRT